MTRMMTDEYGTLEGMIIGRKRQKHVKEDPPQCHVIRHISPMDCPGIEPEPQGL
jgi:hypothetical protein